MRQDLDKRVREIATEHGVPGLSVVISRAGERVFGLACGDDTATSQHPVTVESRFGIASLTKMMTAIVATRLDEAGELSLDAPVADYYPDLEIGRSGALRFYHLLCHGAGLPGLPGRFHALNLDDPNDSSGGVHRETSSVPQVDTNEGNTRPMLRTADELADWLNAKDFTLLGPPGAILNYSNESYCLAGGILEKVTGLPFAKLMEKELFAPAGMSRTSIGPVPEGEDDLATPLVRQGGAFVPTRYWNAPLFDPTGGAISTAGDLVTLLDRVFGAETLVTREGRAQLCRPRMRIASLPEASSGYGLGLQHRQLPGNETFYFHSGQRAGISSFAGHLTKARCSIAVLCNLSNVPVNVIAHQILAAFVEREDLRHPPEIGQPRETVLEDADFAGIYRAEEGTALQVDWTDGRLWLQETPRAEPMRFLGPDHGIAGRHSFRFLGPDAAGDRRLALDLRVYRRVPSARGAAAKP